MAFLRSTQGAPAGWSHLALDAAVGLLLHEPCDPGAELAAYVFDGHVGILHGVVKGGCGQEFLVGGHSGHDCDRLHRMDDVRKALAPALRAGMGVDRKAYGPVQN